MRLTDKVAIITGAGHGIGRATALRFALEGAYVVLADIDFESVKDVADEIMANDGLAQAVDKTVITTNGGKHSVSEAAV